MRKRYVICSILVTIAIFIFSFTNSQQNEYAAYYLNTLSAFNTQQAALLEVIIKADLNNPNEVATIKQELNNARNTLKSVDFWLRYLNPLAYKKINAPLPVEWETEVFEKFEKPYKREGAGLTLLALYMEEGNFEKDSMRALIRASVAATSVFTADSTTKGLSEYHHFFLCNRLFLLNLAAIYTTGFECPDRERIIPELKALVQSVGNTNEMFNKSFPATPLPPKYLQLYRAMLAFVGDQPLNYTLFDHYTFLKDYVNPLFILNQGLIARYNVVSRSMVDYTLNNKATSIFDKHLYNGQNTKGIFLRVNDTAALASIEHIGKQLFYDPLLSGNNQRSCASCHKPTQYFTDTAITASLHFDGVQLLPRNSPSLVNSIYNHLLMLDGKHYSLQDQTKGVVTNPNEMNCTERELLKKVMSCKEYKKTLKQLLTYTPQEKEVTFQHIASAITYYYGQFSNYNAPFDEAMNKTAEISASARRGFNLFMSKAQCGACHFVPQFNGVKPPYVSSEFEVLGVPADTLYRNLSPDEGRYVINAAKETRNAFRTGSIRNAAHTKPYMHNGVFNTLEQVIEFYNTGGGAAHGLKVANQTLSADSLHLTAQEKIDIISFMQSLNEQIVFDTPPYNLPASKNKSLNNRVLGGSY